MKSIIVFFCIIISDKSFSQEIAKKDIETAAKSIAKYIDDNYVYPEKGKKIAAHFLQSYKKGVFENCRNWRMFDSLATRVLREFSNDGHLYVRNDPTTIKELITAEKDTNDTTPVTSDDPFFYGAAAVENNFGFRETKVLEENVGYIRLSEINISAKSLSTLFAAMRFVAHTKSLIIDLRDNGGGGSELGHVFESFFLKKDQSLLEFKSRKGQSRVEKTVSWLTEPKYDKPLFIVINNGTASAAEAFAFALQNSKRAAIIGQSSAGAANMNAWYVVNDSIFVSVSVEAPTRPGTDQSWERKGVQPDHVTEKGKEVDEVLRLIKPLAQ